MNRVAGKLCHGNIPYKRTTVRFRSLR